RDCRLQNTHFLLPTPFLNLFAAMKYSHRKRLLRIRSARYSRDWLKKVKIKGSEHLSLYKFFKIFLFNIEQDEIVDRANGVAFNFILAIFPTIIFLFTLIPYVTNYLPDVSSESIMAFLSNYLPPSIYEVAQAT